MSVAELIVQLNGLAALSSGDARLDTVIRLTCGRALSLRPLPSEADIVDGKSDTEATVAAFAEQFCTDVTGIGANQRAALQNALGDRVFRVVSAIFIADFVPRVWAGLTALDLGKPRDTELRWDHDTDPSGPLLAEFVPAVARLRALDPVTTEVVRLRGATQHNCRLCQSLRDSTALQAGGSEDLYADIERFEKSSQLTEAQKAALRYVDALIWTPSDIARDIAVGVRTHYSEEQALELTLDVMRNACNKIAVALEADAPRVESGTEEYHVDADGQTVFA
jgi:alkylhydroperoxidase family enzyme